MAKKIFLLILTVVLSLGLYACAKADDTVDVTFVGLNGKTEIKTVPLGNAVAFPAAPNEDGFEFLGWYLNEEEAKTEVINGFKPAENVTVYAHFRELETYTVKFYKPDGSIFETVYVREDKTIQFPTKTPTLSDNQIFTGWYIGEQAVDAAYFAQNPVTQSLDIRAKARDKVTYTLTLMVGEEVYETITIREGDAFEFNVEDPVKENFAFEGWYLGEDENAEQYSGFRPQEDLTVYAAFSEIPLFDIFPQSASTCAISALNAYYVEKTSVLVIPKTITVNGATYTVVSIADNAFKSNSKLTTITLPETLTTIGASAFQGCSALTSITIPATVTALGASAFKDCAALESVVLPMALTIGADAFKGTAIKNLTASVDAIHAVDVTKLETVTLTAGEIISEKLFKNAKNLTSIVLPNELTKIEKEAFADAMCLKAITIPASVTSIATDAFVNCYAMEAITVADGNAVYESNGSNCIVVIDTKTLLLACKNTIVYEGVKVISEKAFLGCIKLTELNLPATLVEIPEGFLYGCSDVEKITVSADNTSYISVNNCLIRLIDTCLIQGCKASRLPEEFTVNEQKTTITAISEKAFVGCTTLKQIVIPASISTLKANTFKGCKALAQVVIYNPSLTIEENAFAECTAIAEITVPYTLVKTFVNLNKLTLKNVTITETDKIEKDLFKGCTALETVTLPATVTTIGTEAFAGCESLTTVTFAEGSLLSEIKMSAFKGCTALVAFGENGRNAEDPFLIPLNVKNIGEYAFDGCAMQKLAFADGSSLTTIGYKAFSNCKSLVEIDIPRNASAIDYDAFYGCTVLTSASLSASVMRCLLVVADGITSLKITSGEELDYQTVRALIALETLSLSKDIASIDARSLRECTKLVNIIIDAQNTLLKVENDYVLEIASGKLIFAAAKSEITISENVKSIGAYAFVGTGIEKIVIPENVLKIENYAFSACRSLDTLEILGEPEIEEYAFEGCDAIKTVKVYEDAIQYLNEVVIENKTILSKPQYE